MVAAKRSSGKLNAEMFDDVPVLQRKWQAALRPGEKLHEALFHDAEAPVPTNNPALRLASPRTADYAVLARSIDELEENAGARREERLLQLLARLVPEYRRTTSGPSAAAVSGG